MRNFLIVTDGKLQFFESSYSQINPVFDLIFTTHCPKFGFLFIPHSENLNLEYEWRYYLRTFSVRHIPSVTFRPSHSVRHIPSVTFRPSHSVRHIPSVTFRPSHSVRHIPSVKFCPSREKHSSIIMPIYRGYSLRAGN